MRRAGRNLIREVGAETDWGPAAVLPLGVGWGQGDEPVERQVPRQGATRDPATIPRASHHPPDAAAASLQAAAKRTHNYEPYGWRRPGKTMLGTALARRSLTQKRSQGPPLRGPVGSHVSCRGTAGSATAGPPRATDCPARVQNPCPTSTSHNQRCHRILRPSPHGPPAGLRPRLHRRSASTPAGRRPHGDRLFPGDHRDRQRRHPHRPPHPQAAPGPAAPRRHPGGLEARPLARSLRHLVETVTELTECGIGFRSLHEAIDTTTPAASSSFTCSTPWPSSNATCRAPTSAGLAAGRARGRRGGRP
jgi:hypothetical protein